MIDEAWILMSESVVVLPPHMRSQQVVERCNRTPPLDLTCNLQPLGMLVEHGIDDVDERFVTGKETVAPREQITFQPALAHVLTEHLQHTAMLREMFINRQDRLHPQLIGRVVKRLQSVRRRLIRTEDAEVFRVDVQLHHITQESAEDACGLRILGARLRNRSEEHTSELQS